MALEIEGKIVKIFPERSGEGNNGTWTSQDFMIEVPGNYPTKAAFDDFNNAAGIQSCQVGDQVRVSFNIRSNEWQGKYITSLRAWRIEKLGANGGNTTEQPQNNPAPQNEAAPF
ncbi:MAG: DUF3127 domain-containing protein [Bacteroidales bacterium]|nr:DUF3127 domain-containing protein [Bacteroidales bacterium]